MSRFRSLPIACLAILVAAPAAIAQPVETPVDQPAFQWLEKGDRLYRLDTATGAVAVCTRLNGSLACREGASERAAWRQEINELRERLDLLERQVVELELRVDEQVIDKLATGTAEMDSENDAGDVESENPPLAPQVTAPSQSPEDLAETDTPAASDGEAQEETAQTGEPEKSADPEPANRVQKVLDGSRELLRNLAARARQVREALVQ